MIVGVLLGAGPPVKKRTEKLLLALMKDVLSSLPMECENPTELAVQIAIQLENSPITNAGRGSSLNRDGEVECDACIVRLKNGRKVSASVGSVKGIRNPIRVPHKMLEHLELPKTDLGRPLFIAGQGAAEYAISQGLEQAKLATASQQRSHEYWQKLSEQVAPYQDTIGVIVATDTEIAVCSSSGGSILKIPGRIGSAAVPGAACDVDKGIAAVCSGFGEDMMACRLASLACSAGLDQLPSKLDLYDLQRQPYHGILRAEQVSGGWQLEAAHSTESFAFGWTKLGGKPFVKVSHQAALIGTFLSD
ncbi:Putative L-asparaginase [Wickerhamiella sorbophila]|uniref:L-asparaginase n=1 Tax=Wickerhamiella sorbophila TaxID=45607 RepID=A0A2T0FIN8_9ASCO|nr:Putative L-asparaginase [Wickerhamiella sorbophila]PRT54850.1 Putative L-asparaginase [Wickerhamiella sorbophila]